MKKVFVLIITFTFLISFDVFALDYKVTNVMTTFSEEIDFSDINKIKLIFLDEGIDYNDDAASIVNLVELSQENNYSQILNNVKIVDKDHLFAMVENDNYGVYDCNITLDTSIIDTANINIFVSKNNLPKNELSSIPSDILEKIVGTSVAKPNETINKNNTTTNENQEIVITTTEKKETTVYREELKKRHDQQEKEKNKKKNNIITIALFLILGIILFAALLFVVYKFVTANK